MTSSIVFAGDSITDADRLITPDGLGDGYVRLIADALAVAPGPGLAARGPLLNRGVSGDRVVDLARRWDADVVAHAPVLLSVFVGINDTWRRYDADDPTSTADFASGYRDLLDRAVAGGVERLVLVEPFLLPVSAEQRTWFEDLDPKRAAVADLAAAFGAAFVPLQDPLTAAAAEHGTTAIAGDGIHPSPAGSELIARAWLDAAAGLLGP